jgi:hypothetical protein
MGFETIGRIRSWSPTNLGVYEQCPRKAYYKLVKRMPDVGGPAANRGIELHKWCERYVRGEIQKEELPADLKKVMGFLDHYRNQYAKGFCLTEQRLAFTEEWALCDWKSSTAWLRLVIDIVEFMDADCHLVEIADWKSGKLKKDDEGYGKQLNLYTVAALSAGWALKAAKSKLIFIDHGVEIPSKDLRDEFVELMTPEILRRHQRKWEIRAERMLEDHEFCMNPSYLCKFCPYSSRYAEGPCEF